MMHRQRRWSVTSVSFDSLVDRLHKNSWTLCTGFVCVYKGCTRYFLNDSTSEDALQEYVVLAPNGMYVDSLTVGWAGFRTEEDTRKLLGSVFERDEDEINKGYCCFNLDQLLTTARHDPPCVHCM